LHDNTRPHTANQKLETINELGFELMEHPPCSLDLCPSDLHVFVSIKGALRGRRCSSDEEVIRAVQNWLKTQPKTFFLTKLKKLVRHWNRYVEK
jgi:histone-lysine N-methyltransferase SETMAR